MVVRNYVSADVITQYDVIGCNMHSCRNRLRRRLRRRSPRVNTHYALHREVAQSHRNRRIRHASKSIMICKCSYAASDCQRLWFSIARYRCLYTIIIIVGWKPMLYYFLGRKMKLPGISPAKLSRSGPNSVYVDMSRGDNVQRILGAIGQF